MTEATSTFWARKSWNYDQWTDDLGVWVLGKVVEKRFHTTTIKDAVLRHEATVVKVSHAFKREFNEYSNEIAPDFKNPQNTKNVKLSFTELASLMNIPEGMMPKPHLVHPAVDDQFEFWVSPKDSKKYDDGDDVIVKTHGGWFPIEISRNDGTFGSSFGRDDELMGAVGGIMDKIDEPDVLDHEKNEGVDSDEWDDY